MFQLGGITTTIILFGGMLLLLVLGLPIPFCLGGISLLLALFTWGPASLYLSLSGTYGVWLMFSLACAPMFSCMGVLLVSSGIGEEMFKAIQYWLGPVNGSLAVAVVGVATLMGAMVGSISATTITMGLVALPLMLKLKYDKSLAIGCIQAGAAMAFLIPPSTIAVIYALIAKVSIGRMFAGGLFPGILLAILFITYILIRCYFQPSIGPALPPEERVSMKVKLQAIKGLIAPLVVIIVMMGSIFAGWATPVESSAVGLLATIIVVAAKRKFTWASAKESLTTVVRIGGSTSWIFMSAMTFGKLYDGLGARAIIEPLVLGLPFGKWGIMAIMMVSWMIMGTALDDTAILLITAPVYLPIVTALGFDPIWFGVCYLLNMQIAYLTPPFGYCLFLMKAVAPPGISMVDIYKSIGPFVVLQTVGLFICMFVPQIILWAPNVFFGVLPAGA